MNTYKLHFRYRTTPTAIYRHGELMDEMKEVTTTSQKAARELGKKLAAEKERYWFMGLYK